MNDSVQTHMGDVHMHKGCRFYGMSMTTANREHEHCFCDPDGSRAQKMLDLKRQWNREHVLHQKKVWYNIDGEEIRLKDMSLRYKRNVLNFLERRAYKFWNHEWAQMSGFAASLGGDMAIDCAESMMYEHEDKDPVEWLYETPFVKRLVKLINKGQDGPID